jgi:Arc/MetJ-type ribon-helix-helix transcriptional regulator
MEENMRSITVKVPDEQFKRIEDNARNCGVNKSEYIRSKVDEAESDLPASKCRSQKDCDELKMQMILLQNCIDMIGRTFTNFNMDSIEDRMATIWLILKRFQ